MTDVEEDVMDEDSDLEGLAEKLAELSSGEVPTGFGRPPLEFDLDQVDWSTNDWLARVAEVQDWLRLDAPMDLTKGAEAALYALFAAAPEPARCFTLETGHAVLTDAGISIFAGRLDTAIGLKQEFAEAVDSGRSAKDATDGWIEAWDETPGIAEDPPADVHAKVDTWNISMFRDRALAGGIELNPTYQRDNVWSDKESSELIDSIMRGIPLPSIILNQRKGDDSLEIVDGKQRLTAILRFIGYHPQALKFAAQVEAETPESPIKQDLFHSDYAKWKALVKRQRGLTIEDERDHFLPFKYSIPRTSRDTSLLRGFSGKYYSQIQKDPKAEVQIQGRAETVRKVFELPMSSYKLSVILYEDTDIHQIHKVFGLYNRQGKKLNQTEVRNAIYHHLHIAKLLLLLSGDNPNVAALAPYLQESALDLQRIPGLLRSLSVGDGRFNRTKLTSWVAAIIVHRFDAKSGLLSWPGSTSLVEGMMRAVADSKTHAMVGRKACEHLAYALYEGATLLDALRSMDAFPSEFASRGAEKWEELPAVASWLACTLARIAGVEASPSVRAAVLAATKRVERLKKQQARTQWGYLARVTLELLEAMEVDVAALGSALEKRFGYNCIPALEARRA